MGFLGKLFLTVALTGQAFLLYSNEAVIRDFETNLVKLHGLATLSNVIIILNQSQTSPLSLRKTFLPLSYNTFKRLFKPHCISVQQSQDFWLRPFSSSFQDVPSIFLWIYNSVAFFPFVGVALQILVQSNPSLDASQNTQVNLLKNLATAGAVLLWSASDCARWAENKAAKAKSS